MPNVKIIANGIIAEQAGGNYYYKNFKEFINSLTETPIEELDHLVKHHETNGSEYYVEFKITEIKDKDK